VTDDPDVLGQFCLYWGVMPMFSQDIQRQDALRHLIQQWAKTDSTIRPGDRVILVVDTEELAGVHDLVMVIEIGRE
jgi:hypothetical protein